MDTAAEKAAQRKAGIAARRALSEADRAAANAALCRRIAQLRCFREAQTLLAYAAFGGEADLSALLAEAERLGKTVAYPVCGEGFTLTAAVPEAVILETDAPHILSASMPGWRSEVIMNFLEGREVYVSKSSACKQGKRSHVLEAIGMRSDRIDGSIRIGLSRYTTEEDIEALVCGLSDARALAHR